jgi:hypothetical protein
MHAKNFCSKFLVIFKNNFRPAGAYAPMSQSGFPYCPVLLMIDQRVNWIYAITNFTGWRYTITKIKLIDMPFQLSHTSNYVISSNTCLQTAPILRTYIYISEQTRKKRKKVNRTKFLSILLNQRDAAATPWKSRFQPRASSRNRTSYSGGAPPAAASREPLQLQDPTAA